MEHEHEQQIEHSTEHGSAEREQRTREQGMKRNETNCRVSGSSRSTVMSVYYSSTVGGIRSCFIRNCKRRRYGNEE